MYQPRAPWAPPRAKSPVKPFNKDPRIAPYECHVSLNQKMQQKFAPKIKERQVTHSREEVKERQAKDDSDNSTQQPVRVLHVINFLELIEFHVRVQPIDIKILV